MRDLRQLARDIQALKMIYPDRPGDNAKRVFFTSGGEVVCVNGVPLGVKGFSRGGRPVSEINIMLKIPSNYPIKITGESHEPQFGIPRDLCFRRQDLSGMHVWQTGSDWSDNNWAWVCLLFSARPPVRNLIASVNLLVGSLRLFARTGE